MPNSIPMSRLYILTVCIRVSSSFSFFAKSLMSSMYIKWLTFSCDLLSLYPAVPFLSMSLSGNMVIMNSKGDIDDWKITLWIFASANLPPAISSTLQVLLLLLLSLRVIYNCFKYLFFTRVQVTKRPPNILVDPKRSVFLKVSTHPLCLNISSFLSKLLRSFPSAPTTICMTITFMLHHTVCFLMRFRYC